MIQFHRAFAELFDSLNIVQCPYPPQCLSPPEFFVTVDNLLQPPFQVHFFASCNLASTNKTALRSKTTSSKMSRLGELSGMIY